MVKDKQVVFLCLVVILCVWKDVQNSDLQLTQLSEDASEVEWRIAKW